MRTLHELIDELQVEAHGAAVAALIVRFEAWHDYVFPGDTPSPLATLGKMVVAGGDPIALVVARQTSPAKASAYVRLLADHADDPQLRNELGQLAEDFKSYLKEHGLPEPSPLDTSSPTELIDGFESAPWPQSNASEG